MLHIGLSGLKTCANHDCCCHHLLGLNCPSFHLVTLLLSHFTSPLPHRVSTDSASFSPLNSGSRPVQVLPPACMPVLPVLASWVLSYKPVFHILAKNTWFISSTTLKGHLLSSCKAIKYNIVDTLLSPPLWWCGVSSWSCVLLRNLTLIRIPYLSYSSCQMREAWEKNPFYTDHNNGSIQISQQGKVWINHSSELKPMLEFPKTQLLSHKLGMLEYVHFPTSWHYFKSSPIHSPSSQAITLTMIYQFKHHTKTKVSRYQKMCQDVVLINELLDVMVNLECLGHLTNIVTVNWKLGNWLLFLLVWIIIGRDKLEYKHETDLDDLVELCQCGWMVEDPCSNPHVGLKFTPSPPCQSHRA